MVRRFGSSKNPRGGKSKEEDHPMQIRAVGIDLGKTIFHIVAMDEHGKVLVRKRFSRTELLTYTANLPTCLIGMEACCGAHFLGTSLQQQGHQIRLIPAQFVKPFVKSNKNDYVDAEAIAEAVQRANMRFVPLKSQDQLDLQAIHRVRDRLMQRRTSLINQLRAFFLERGITVRAGVAQLKRKIPELLQTAEQTFSLRMTTVIRQLMEEWRSIEQQLNELNLELQRIAEADCACRRLLTIPGIGPLAATAIVAAVGNGAAFAKGRDFAAWLGLVPKQCSTGGKPKLLGISKRGNNYVRWLLIHGARSVITRVRRDRLRFGEWLTALQLRAHPNVVGVALAAKLARIAWAVLSTGEPYRSQPIPVSASCL
jgi:transposase